MMQKLPARNETTLDARVFNVYRNGVM